MDSFQDLTNRHQQRAAFSGLLEGETRWIMPIRGLSGIGKSFLFFHLVQLECERLGARHARVDLGLPHLRSSYLHILDQLESELEDAISSEHWDAYRAERSELLRRQESQRQTFVQRFEAVDGATVQNVTQNIDARGALLASEERTRDGVTEAFVRCVARDQSALVVFVDRWENVQEAPDKTLAAWLIEGLFAGLHRRRPQTRLVVAGRQGFDYPGLQRETLPTSELEEFSQADADEFLSRRGITDPQVQRMVYDWVHGHPLLTAMLADQGEERLRRGLSAGRPEPSETTEIIAGWVRERVLEGLPDQERDLLTCGVVLRRFDLDALKALFPARELDFDAFRRFTAHSFVQRLESGWAFYDLVRRGQLHDLKEISFQSYLDFHERARAYYEARWRREQIPERRRLWRLELLYHHFAVDEPGALSAWWQDVRDAERGWEREWWRMLLELPAADGRVDLGKLFKVLAEWEITSVLVEGGGTLSGALFDYGLVDKVIAFIAPLIIGGREAQTAVAGRGVDKVQDSLKLEQVTVERFGEDVMVSGYVGVR